MGRWKERRDIRDLDSWSRKKREKREEEEEEEGRLWEKGEYVRVHYS